MPGLVLTTDRQQLAPHYGGRKLNTTDNPNRSEEPERQEAGSKGLHSAEESEASRGKRLFRTRLIALVSLLLLFGLAVYSWKGPGSGVGFGQGLGGGEKHAQAQAETYYCPMHTNYK